MTETDATRSLRDVRRQQATERRRMKEQQQRTRQRMENMTDRQSSEQAERIRRHNAVVTGMVPRIAGAIDSWAGHRVPMTVNHPARRFFAATDFKSIEISIPPVEGDVTVDFAADLRGLAYHEAGHILKSMPFPVLLDHVMPLDPGSSPHKRDQTLSKMTGIPEGKIHQAWNVLEDQRMESAMVRESKNLGRYYNVIVLQHVLTGGVSDISYLWIYGRKHVDEAVRTAARAAMVQAEGEATVQEAERLIDQYKQSNDPAVLWESVIRFGQLIGRSSRNEELGNGAMDTHKMGDLDEFEGDEFDLDDSAEPDGEGQGEGDESDGDGEEGTGSARGDGDDDDDADDAEDQEGGDTADRQSHGDSDAFESDTGASKSVNDADWDRQLVERALDEAREARNRDGNVLNDVKAYNQALINGRSKMPVERIPYTVEPDAAVTSEAIKLNRALRNLMEQARAESAPTWQTQQRSGVLDVRAYITEAARRHGGTTRATPRAARHLRLPNMAVSLAARWVGLDGSPGPEPRHRGVRCQERL